MANKLYEAATVQKLTEALRKRIKSYYTLTKEERVINASAGGENIDNYNDGDATLTGSGDWKVNASSKRFTPDGETKQPDYVYENKFKIEEVGPYLKSGETTPSSTANKKKFYLGIKNLITRWGFPDNKYMNFTGTYAPDNGWICVRLAGDTKGWVAQITNNTSGMVVRSENMQAVAGSISGLGGPTPNAGEGTRYQHTGCVIMPVSRLDNITIAGNSSAKYFIPAKKTNMSKTDDTKQYSLPYVGTGSSATVIAIGTTSYTVTSDGWLEYIGNATSSFCELTNNANNMRVTCYGDNKDNIPSCFLVVAKGAVISISRSGGTLKFISAYKP